MRDEVERARAHMHARCGNGARHRGRWRDRRTCLPLTQYAFHASAQFAEVERLHHVVVGAHFQPGDAVRDVGGAGDHDDADVEALAQEAGQREAVLARQVDVEQDDVGQALLDCLAHRRAAVGLRDLVTVRGQVLGEHFAHRRVVLDDQDAAVAGHE